MIIPLTNFVSERLPVPFFAILTSSVSTMYAPSLFRATCCAALTTSLANISLTDSTEVPVIDVAATDSRTCKSSMLTDLEFASRISIVLCIAS